MCMYSLCKYHARIHCEDGLPGVLQESPSLDLAQFLGRRTRDRVRRRNVRLTLILTLALSSVHGGVFLARVFEAWHGAGVHFLRRQGLRLGGRTRVWRAFGEGHRRGSRRGRSGFGGRHALYLDKKKR